MTPCIQCRSALPSDRSRFCPECGADQSGGGPRVITGSVGELRARLQRIVRGQYELLRPLGRGGMGVVFLAQDLSLERQVAIKVLPPDFSTDPQVIRRFQQEAKTAARLDHPNIIPIYRVESQEGINYFVMKFISGTSLEDVLEARQPLSDDYVQRILWEAACALGHAHSRGVVHRDVKPANIMFDHDGRVMLTDFGISKALHSASGLTGTGMIIGTPHYMAPEQAKGQPVDGRADEYSLGVVGYRLLTRSLPFSGDSVHTILYKHIFEEAPHVAALRRDVPAHLTEPVQRALAKDPGQRYPTMEAFAAAIWPERPVSTISPVAPRPPLASLGMRASASSDPTVDRAARTTPMHFTRPRPAPKRRFPAEGLLILLLIAGASGGGYLLLRGSGLPDTRPAAPADSVAAPVARDTSAPDSPFSATAGTRASPPPRPRSTPPAASAPPVTRESTAASVATEGYLTIDADPFGTVFVDGVNAGPTPLTRFPVAPGSHRIRIERLSYQTIDETVEVTAGNLVRRRYSLVPEP